MKAVNEIVKTLRWIASNDEICFNAEQANNAAELLEQQQKEIEQLKADRDQWKRVAEASRDVIQPKLRMEIEELKAKQARWIPIILKYDNEEGMNMLQGEVPDDEQPVLVTNGKSVWEDVFLRDGAECYLGSNYDLGDEVMAWQPLPEPFKGEEE